MRASLCRLATVGSNHRALDAIEGFDHRRHVAALPRHERVRSMDHHESVVRHDDLVAGHGDDGCSRRGDAVDVDGLAGLVAGERVEDRGGGETIAARTIDPDRQRLRRRASSGRGRIAWR